MPVVGLQLAEDLRRGQPGIANTYKTSNSSRQYLKISELRAHMSFLYGHNVAVSEVCCPCAALDARDTLQHTRNSALMNVPHDCMCGTSTHVLELSVFHSDEGAPGQPGHISGFPGGRLGLQHRQHLLLRGVLLPNESLNELQELNEIDASGTISIKVIEYTLNFVGTHAPACEAAAAV
jgi:hypothetical protein